MLKYPQKLRCTTARIYHTHTHSLLAGAHRNLHPLKILNHHKFKDQTLFGKQDWQIYSTALIKLHFNNRPGLGKADDAAKRASDRFSREGQRAVPCGSRSVCVQSGTNRNHDSSRLPSWTSHSVFFWFQTVCCELLRPTSWSCARW